MLCEKAQSEESSGGHLAPTPAPTELEATAPALCKSCRQGRCYANQYGLSFALLTCYYDVLKRKAVQTSVNILVTGG